jgi:hypothetical protein
MATKKTKTKRPVIILNPNSFCPISFVGNSNFRQDVIDILEKYLLGSGRKNKYSYMIANPKSPTITKNFYPNNLDDWYDNKSMGIINSVYLMQGKRPKNPQKEGFISASTLTSQRVNTKNLQFTANGVMAGLDTPVWFDFDGIDWTKEKIKPNPKNSNERIMVISQDPRRNQKEMGYPTHSDCIALSTPFGWHDYDWRNRQNNLIPQIFKGVLAKKKVSLYFTDVYKLRKMEPSDIDDKNKNIYKKILEEEINLFDPTLIVTFGTEASKELIKMYLHRVILHLPHPSCRLKTKMAFIGTVQKITGNTYTKGTNRNFVDACIDII